MIETLLAFVTVPVALVATLALVLFWSRNSLGLIIALGLIAEALAWFLGLPTLGKYIYTNPWDAAYYAAIYLGFGVVWAGFKFDRLAKKAAEKCAKDYDRYVKDPKSHSMPIIALYQPRVTQHKEEITCWTILWWASAIDFIFHGLLDEIWNFFVTSFGRIFDAIAARHFKRFTPVETPGSE